MIKNLIIFLLINFGALALGAEFTGSGVSSEWYADLAKAPWTPPGWVFGAAWTTIMICFSVFMAKAISTVENRKFLIGLFIAQVILNVSWNPIFFKYHLVTAGLVVISLLTFVVGLFIIKFSREMKNWILLVLLYAVWLLIATSLNAYVLFFNEVV